MALLEPREKESWNAALDRAAGPWIAFGLDAAIPLGSDRVAGLAALIDWRLHGQVSRRIADGLSPNSFCLFPLPGGARTFLLYHYLGKPDPAAFAERARALGLRELLVAERTFPEDFPRKLKHALEELDVRYATLEPDCKAYPNKPST